jgi:DNA-3-methyladenine glycosylase II
MNYAIAIDYLKESDPILGQLIDRIGMCQLHQHELQGDLFFCLSRSILHQQLSTKVANVIHGRFLQLYPDTQFPSAQDVLDTPDEVLAAWGFHAPKSLT